MSRNGSGTYNLPAGNPVVSGATITSSWANTTMQNIADGLTQSVASDGQTPMTGALNMANNKITSVTDPTNAQDAATKSYVDAVGFTVAPGTSGNVLTSNGTIWTSAAATTIPAGSMQMWPTATAPTGYLLCAGAAVSRTTYAALYAVIGTTYGVGDGTTTFNVPDLRGRSPFGVSGSYALASTGGSADAVVVSHNHTAASVVSDTATKPQVLDANINTSSNVGSLSGSYGFVGSNVSEAGYITNDVSGNPYVKGIAASVTVATTNTAAGVSGTGANLAPYLAINFIIKV
jgi:microcystin-dependent protein